jgi:hypothetical protein
LARSSPGKITLTTPLSRANNANTQIRGARRTPTAPPRARRTCRVCGADLYGSARQLCPTCWPVARKEQMRQIGLARAKDKTPTLQQYREQILPSLAEISLPEIERATGLSNASCSRLRSGKQIPNPRHWPALAKLVNLSGARSDDSERRRGAMTLSL